MLHHLPTNHSPLVCVCFLLCGSLSLVPKHVDVSCSVRMPRCPCGRIWMPWCTWMHFGRLLHVCSVGRLWLVCCGCNLWVSSSDRYHQYFAKKNGHRQMLDITFCFSQRWLHLWYEALVPPSVMVCFQSDDKSLLSPSTIEKAPSTCCDSSVHVFKNHLNWRVLTQNDNCQLCFFEKGLIMLGALVDQGWAFAGNPH